MKKRTRLLIVGLMIIAITGASTLAYFTSGVKLNSSNDGNLKLDITNGIVKITEGNGGSYVPTWTYSLATGATDKDRSPDITGFTDTKSPVNGAGTYERLEEGSKLIINNNVGTVGNARPGDALLLSSVDESGVANSNGLVINNESTLTIKCKVVMDTSDAAKNQLNTLLSGGWVLNINGVIIDSTEGLDSKLDSISDTISKELNSVNKKTNLIIKLELPLIAGNSYQGSNSGTVSNFNISQLFSIIATQENNPGWNESGE